MDRDPEGLLVRISAEPASRATGEEGEARRNGRPRLPGGPTRPRAAADPSNREAPVSLPGKRA